MFGLIGSILSVPVAVWQWFSFQQAGGLWSNFDKSLIFVPHICLCFWLTGYLWIRVSRKSEPRKSPGSIMEGGGSSGDVGGF